MKLAIVALALLLTACGKDGPTHGQLLDKGCTVKARQAVDKVCSKYGCSDIRGTVYSCPAYETKLAD